MIRNGLYHITVEMLDGVQGGNQGVMVLRDGTLRGGNSFFYAYGTYTSANGKWKDLPELIPMTQPKATAWRSPASRPSDSNRSCAC